MRVFVGEYICGGGLIGQPDDEIPVTLKREGRAMLRALLHDVSRFAKVACPVDARFGPELTDRQEKNWDDVPQEVKDTFDKLGIPEAEKRFLAGVKAQFESEVDFAALSPTRSTVDQWVQLASNCDAAIIVAPETDGILLSLIEAFRAASIRVMAPESEFLVIAADKWQTAKRMQDAGIPHPKTHLLGKHITEHEVHKTFETVTDVILKPRDDCGSQGIRAFPTLTSAMRHAREGVLLQEHLTGHPVSISVIARSNELDYLPACSQSIDPKTFAYHGGEGPLEEELHRRALSLAERVMTALPVISRGFVSLDLLLREQSCDDTLIEINPRVTTSYVGLRKMVEGNLARRVFDLELSTRSCCIASRSIRWASDGTIKGQPDS